jgi:GNAT superfamily N-acetyltransferase
MNPVLRRATRADVSAIVALIADDQLGAAREEVGPELDPAYLSAFDAIARDPNQLLLVAETDGRVVATCQLTFIPGLSRRGAWRAQLEAVRVAGSHRGSGLGGRLIEAVIAEARARRCGLVQLTSDLSRSRAHAFYERHGFAGSHLGMKLLLDR